MQRLPVALLLVLVACASSITPSPTLDVPTPTPSLMPSSSPTSAATPSPAASDELAEEVMRIVRSDPTVDAFLDRNAFRVDEVVVDGDWIHLLVAFDGPMFAPSPWETVCEASFAGGRITGGHWIIDADASSVVASSPLWGEYSCAPLPETT